MSTLNELTHLSDLTLALAGVGGVVLAGLVAHGAWSARRAGPKRADAPSPLDLPAATAELVEPVFGDEPVAGAGAVADAHDEAASPLSTSMPDLTIDGEPSWSAPAARSGAGAAGAGSARADGTGAEAAGSEARVGVDAAGSAVSAAAAGAALPAGSAPAARSQPLARRAVPRIDALIDAIATLSLEAPISGDAVLTQLPASRRAGTKPLLIEGQHAASGEWEALRAGQRYRELQAGVQLANRAGPLNEIEYSEFVQKVQAMADGIGTLAASVDLPDMLDVVARARELDAFAGAHDAQLAVQLRARGAAWSIGYLQQQASRHGFVAGSLPGRLVLPAAVDGAPPVLTLSFNGQAALADDPNQAALRDVTLAFDVPQTGAEAEPFSAWQAAAQALALAIDADIVDDAGQPLSAAGFAAIGGELQQLYDALARRELAAGSAAARRLFS